MADETTFPDILRGALLTIPGLHQFFDGNVPEKVDETDGFIDPYVVLWGGLGENPFEPTACGTHNSDTLIWDFQLTVVAASPDLCRRVARAVRLKVLNMVIGTGRVKPNPDGFQQQAPIRDAQVTPNRFMLPLQMRITTN